MAYSELINPAAEIIAEMVGCSFSSAKEYIEDTIFNSECSLKEFFVGIFDMSDVPVEEKNIKAEKRDFWKKPADVQMRLWLGMSPDEYETFENYSNSKIPEERLAYRADRNVFWDESDKWQGRHYARLNGCGIWCNSYGDECRGIFTKQQRREKKWKKFLEKELIDEEIYPLRVRG